MAKTRNQTSHKDRTKNLRLLGQGNNGKAYAITGGTYHGAVAKCTSDPLEISACIGAQALQESRGRTDYGAFPRIHSVQMGDNFAVILRENVRPLRAQELSDRRHGGLARLSRAYLRGQRASLRALSGPFSNIRFGVLALDQQYGVRPGDIRHSNVGVAAGGRLALHDPGRPGAETSRIRAGGLAPCPALGMHAAAIEGFIGRAPTVNSCSIVSPKGMQDIMGRHGWSPEEIRQTAGFHSPDHDIALRQREQWALPHELFHAAGIDSEDLGVWFSEGLAEAATQDYMKRYRVKHISPYEEWTSLIRTSVAPSFGLSVRKLATLAAENNKNAGKRLARVLSRRLDLPVSACYKAIKRGSTPAAWNRLLRRAGRL